MEREVQKLKHMYEECNKNPKKCSFKRHWNTNALNELTLADGLAS